MRTYTRSAETGEWIPDPPLPLPELRAQDNFGAAVAIDGDRMAVGAPGRAPVAGATRAGAVFMYRRDDAGWTLTGELPFPPGALTARFGEVLALDGDVLAVGAPRRGVDGVSDSGAVFAFAIDSGPPASWDYRALDVPARSTADYVGRALAVRDGRVLVGAAYEDGGPASRASAIDDAVENAGAVHVFERRGAEWAHIGYLKAPDPCPSGHFGEGVAFAGETIIVGSPHFSRGDEAMPDCGDNTGAVYHFPFEAIE